MPCFTTGIIMYKKCYDFVRRLILTFFWRYSVLFQVVKSSSTVIVSGVKLLFGVSFLVLFTSHQTLFLVHE